MLRRPRSFAPATPGTAYYGACVDSVTDEADTTDNCSAAVQVEVEEPDATPSPDLVASTPTASNTTPYTGATFTLSTTVTNAGEAASAATTLRYYRATDAAITSNRAEVGRDSVASLPAAGVSAESVSLSAPASPGTVYFSACVDRVAGEAATANNCSASVRVDVETPPGPDLQVGAPTASDRRPAPGTTFTLSATVTNAGDADAAATTLRFYSSTDATITTNDTGVGTADVGALAAGADSSDSISVEAPSSAGTVYYGACVVAVADESNTANNCSGSVQVDVEEPKYPDLHVVNPAVTDSNPGTGATFTLSATVRNAGDADAPATSLRYYRSADAAITTADTVVGTDQVSALSADGSATESILVTAPAQAGTFYYGACVDAVAGESDTSDNCSGAVQVDVQAPPARPDLAVGTPTASDAEPETGAPITLSATVANDGDADAAATTLRFYSSADATISTSDTQVGTATVAALSAGGSSTPSISVQVPSSAGTVYYGACVDTVAGETDTSDNCSGAVQVEVQTPPARPDLAVGTPTASDAEPETGASINLSATVANDGDADAAATTLRFYSSSDATISASDAEVGTAAVGALSASGSTTPSISVEVPSSAGTVYYGVCVDAVAGESDTSDNCSAAVQVDVQTPPARPDLAVGTPTASDAEPETGASINLSATVANVGDADAAATTLRFYSSSDATISASDAEVGTAAVAAVSAGGDSDSSISVQVPSSVGTVYYGACVDAVASEIDTADNCSAGVRIDVQPKRPDLTVGTPTTPGTRPEVNQRITLLVTVTNTGNGNAAATTLTYYRSGDATISTADTRVAADAVGGLGPSASSDQFTTVNVPSYAGTVFYGACVAVVTDESDTANNCSAALQVDVQEPEGEPDLVVNAPTVSNTSPASEAIIRVGATVANVGDATAEATKLHFYSSTDATITTGDRWLGNNTPVSAVPAGSSYTTSILTTVPSEGTVYYGACVEAVSYESDTTNNCSAAVQVDVQAPAARPNLVVGSPTASNTSPETDSSIDLSATVTNDGDGGAAATTLRFYSSTDATISTADAEVGTASVGALSGGDGSSASVSVEVPGTAGTVYYGACVDTVADESDTDDNCSAAVQVDVQAASG